MQTVPLILLNRCWWLFVCLFGLFVYFSGLSSFTSGSLAWSTLQGSRIPQLAIMTFYISPHNLVQCSYGRQCYFPLTQLYLCSTKINIVSHWTEFPTNLTLDCQLEQLQLQQLGLEQPASIISLNLICYFCPLGMIAEHIAYKL